MKEIDIQKTIVEALNYSKCIVWRTNAGRVPVSFGENTRWVKLGPAGMSDIIGLDDKGRFIAIEVKRPETKNRVTEIQSNFLANVKDMGGVTGVATSVEEALEIIRKSRE